MVDEALAAGAIGLSTGLYYEPASAAPTEEVIEIGRPLTARKGLYCTHMRDEGDRVVDSLEESFRIGRELGVPVVISHHKVVGTGNHGRSAETLPIIEKAMRAQKIGLDCYPYCASSTILSFEHTMIGSDGLPHDAAPHPRLWGTFARVLGHYSRGLNLFPLETAVYKMTGLTAKTFGLADRGVLKAGFAADVVLFNGKTIDESATFAKPIQPAKGIAAVIVNGEVVWRGGKPTGARPGRVLARA